MSFPPSSNVCKPRPSSDGAHWANMFRRAAFQLMKFLCGTRFPRAGETGGWTIRGWRGPSGSLLPGSRLRGLSEPAARSAPVAISIRQSPAGAQPGRSAAGCWEGKERRGGALNEDRSPNRPEAGSGRCEGEGRAATKSEAQQPLQLNQFGDKNSAVLPLQWFHKGLSCVGEKPSRGVSLPPLQTGERSTIAATTRAETPFFFILSLFLYFPVSRSLSPSPQKRLWPHLFFSLMG